MVMEGTGGGVVRRTVRLSLNRREVSLLKNALGNLADGMAGDEEEGRVMLHQEIMELLERVRRRTGGGKPHVARHRALRGNGAEDDDG
jgi:hypothetical protein